MNQLYYSDGKIYGAKGLVNSVHTGICEAPSTWELVYDFGFNLCQFLPINPLGGILRDLNSKIMIRERG